MRTLQQFSDVHFIHTVLKSEFTCQTTHNRENDISIQQCHLLTSNLPCKNCKDLVKQLIHCISEWTKLQWYKQDGLGEWLASGRAGGWQRGGRRHSRRPICGGFETRSVHRGRLMGRKRRTKPWAEFRRGWRRDLKPLSNNIINTAWSILRIYLGCNCVHRLSHL